MIPLTGLTIPVGNSSSSNWPHLVGPQSLCNRSVSWRLCIQFVSWFSDGNGFFVIGLGQKSLIFSIHSNGRLLSISLLQCLTEGGYRSHYNIMDVPTIVIWDSWESILIVRTTYRPSWILQTFQDILESRMTLTIMIFISNGNKLMACASKLKVDRGIPGEQIYTCQVNITWSEFKINSVIFLS